MTAEVDITIVGAGVIGCAVARELAQAGREIFVLEKNSGITRGENQSSRNSGVIHAGLYYDRSRRPLKAALCAEGNRLLYRFCEQHGVPHRQTGKLVVAANDEETAVLETYEILSHQKARPDAAGHERLSYPPSIYHPAGNVFFSWGAFDPHVDH